MTLKVTNPLRNKFDGEKVFSWWRVVFSGVLAFILTTIGFTYTRADYPVLSTLIHTLVPMMIFAVVFTAMKSRENAYQQIKVGVLIHVVLTIILFMWAVPPVDSGEWISLISIIFVTSAPSLLVGVVIQISS